MMMNRMRLMQNAKNQLRRLLFVMKNCRRSGRPRSTTDYFRSETEFVFCLKTVFPRSQLSVFNNIRLRITCLGSETKKRPTKKLFHIK